MTEQPVAPSHRVSIPKYIAPAITLGTTFVVRRGMIAAYKGITGNPAPTVQSKAAPLITKMAWAGAMASVVTLVESLVLKAVHEQVLSDEEQTASDTVRHLSDGI